MSTTREKIIELLRSRGSASAAEISHSLNLTAANIRHHLNRMQAEQVVERADNPADKERGRPVYLFRLSAQSRPHNLAGLSQALLRMLYDSVIPGSQKALMPSLADQIAIQCPVIAGSLSQRLARTVQCLKELNYQPRWEARRDGPRFMFAACPYAAIYPAYPELCQMDAYLLEKLLSAAVTQSARVGAGSPPSRYCVFNIETP
jgi:predicted ArsR family transcriptional regulator